MQEKEVIDWLGRGGPWGGVSVQRIDTHAAVVFLTGDRAWKIKKPVRFGYLDFSTSDLRHDALATELRLNRRSAPDLYIAVHPVRQGADGALSLGGEGGIIVDWVLEMRRFPDDALLADVASRGELSDALVQALADHIAEMHASAPVVNNGGGAARLLRVMEGNARSMEAFPAILDADKARDLTRLISEGITHFAPLLDRRGYKGRVRHGHGDLHMGNVAVIDGRPVAFDCLEFDVELATIDVLYDLAFMLMDMAQRGMEHEANLLFNRYVDMSSEDEDAVALLPLMMAIRATIRAHVMAAQAGQTGDSDKMMQARHYLDFALALVGAERKAQLIAVGGLSGTGKSTLAKAIGGAVPPLPGARILRSDVLRKRLAGVLPETHLPSSAYTKDTSRQVYAELARLSAQALAGGATGWPVIADAVFAQEEERRDIHGVAEEAGVPFHGLWLYLSEEGRVARIEDRRNDASDATSEIVRLQTQRHPDMPQDWECLKADGNRKNLCREALLWLGLVQSE